MDHLTEMYNEWKGDRDEAELNLFQAFQGGVSAGAVSLRARAILALDHVTLNNDQKNALLKAIGELSDIAG